MWNYLHGYNMHCLHDDPSINVTKTLQKIIILCSRLNKNMFLKLCVSNSHILSSNLSQQIWVLEGGSLNAPFMCSWWVLYF